MGRRKTPVTDRLIDIAAREQAQAQGAERRQERRYAYDAVVAVVLVSPTRERGRQLVLQARDLSLSGIRVASRQMIYPGSEGAIQLVRSDGRIALIGVKVAHSEYAGGMEHHTAMVFTPLPPEISPEEFLDKRGRLLLMDARLEKNSKVLSAKRRK